MILGIGGWRLLRALGIQPQVCHLNEGHAAFAVLERARDLTADSETWLGLLAKEKNLLWALLTRKIRIQGNPKWLLAFQQCFRS